jgi:hypothetical protein
MSDREQVQDFRLTRMENEVEFFKKTTEQSIMENGKKIDKILNVLQADDSIGERGLVQDVKFLKKEYYGVKNFIQSYKLAVAMVVGVFTTVAGVIGWYLSVWLKR